MKWYKTKLDNEKKDLQIPRLLLVPRGAVQWLTTKPRTPMDYHKWLLQEMGGENPDNRPAVLELSLLWCRVVSLADSTDEVKSVGECVLEQVFGDTEPSEKWLVGHINTTMGTITVQPQQVIVIVNNIHSPPPSCPLPNSFGQQ